MIYVERAITISNNTATIESPIVLYKGDKNVQLLFIINNNPFKYKNALEPTYGQLIVKRDKADPIFSEVAKLSNNRVQFIVTEEMIDELRELGNYTFQIRLLNDEHTSRGTLPPVEKGIEIREPILEEEIPNTVNVAEVGLARVSEENKPIETFVNGNYNRTEWLNGDKITDVKLNKVEDAIFVIQANLGNKSNVDHIHNQYLIEVPSEYIKQEDLEILLATKSDVGHIHEQYLTEVPSEYITETELETALNEDKNNPIFNNSITLGVRGALEKVGSNSLVIGTFSSVEGNNSVAIGEGTNIYGNNSIAIGKGTTVLKDNGVAIGEGTKVGSSYQFVSGKFNEVDTEEKYAHIVGNGTFEEYKNIYTLDWDGSAWFNGKISQELEPTEDKDLATKGYVDKAISNIEINGDIEVNLNGYAKLEDLEGYAPKEHEHEAYLTEHQDISHLALKTDLENYAEKEHTHEQYLEEHQNISHLATKEELNGKADEEHEHSQYLTEHQSLVGYATETFVSNAIANAQLGGDNTEIDLSGYATKDDLTTKADKEHTHEEYLTEHQNIDHKVDKEEGKSLILNTEIERLATLKNYDDTEVKGLIEGKANEEHEHEQYLTEHQSLEGYAKTTDIPSIEGLASEGYVDNAIANIPKEEIDLTDYALKTDIPTKTSELTNDSNFLTEHQSLDEYAKLTDIPSLDDYAKKEDLTTVVADGNRIVLTTNKYQYVDMSNAIMPTIYLPTVTTFTEIHLFFIANETTINIYSDGVTIKYQDELTYEVGNTYEFIATYVPPMNWLIGRVEYK